MPNSRALPRTPLIVRRALALAALIMAALFGITGTALAHNVLLNTDPPNGAQLGTGPQQVQLVFDQPVRPGYDVVTVVGPGGTYWTDAPAQINGDTVTEAVRPLGPAGTYSVGYRILSNDGHPVSGQVSFVLTKPGNGTPAPRPAAEQQVSSQQGGGGMPIWPWIVGAVVLVLAGLVLALRLGKPPANR